MAKPSKTIEEKYKKLDDIEHCLLRPGRYLGSVNPHTANAYILNEETKFEKKEVTWCPALIKTFDEIISNSVDFSKTFEGQHLNTIKVEIDQEKGEISVWDNGGIVVVKNKDLNQYVPEMIFELKAGSNFDDDDDSTLTGQNGEGAALTVIFSKEFNVKTADGKNQFTQTHTENARKKTEPKISPSNKNFTDITWTPDYPRFNLTELDEDNYQKLIKRVYDVAGCNPNLKIYLNGRHIKINSFDDYVLMYSDNYAYDENDNWKIAIGKAEEGFEHITFVNGTETIIGGTHISYISDQIISKLREYFKKKHKVEVKPSDIKNHLQLFINATIVKPRYSSQVKDELITEVKSYNTSWECNDKFIKKILSLDIIQSVLDWVRAKEQAQLNSELRKLNKNLDKANPKKIPKFHDATSKNRRETSIHFVEGDCLEENTEIIVNTEKGFISKQIKNIKVGDKVLTHLGNVKKVSSVQHRIKNVYRLNSSVGQITASKEHKIFIYNTLTDKFEFLQLEFIDKNIHKLVKSKLIDYDLAIAIEEVINLFDDSKYNLEFRYYDLNNEENFIKTSLTHKFGCFDLENQKFIMIEAQSLNIKTHLLLLKYNN